MYFSILDCSSFYYMIRLIDHHKQVIIFQVTVVCRALSIMEAIAPMLVYGQRRQAEALIRSKDEHISLIYKKNRNEEE